MSRFTNDTINRKLSNLRQKLRDGTVTVSGGRLKEAVEFELSNEGLIITLPSVGFFTAARFNPQTLRRFETLFEVPMTDHQDHVHYPTQDEYAWALNNFQNRRSDPWKHVKPVPAETTATVAA